MKSLRYLFEALLAYLSYGVVRCLPVGVASWSIGTLAKLIGPYLKAHRTAEKNLTTIFPEMQDKERRDLLAKMWENLGRTVGEFSYIGRASASDYEKIVTLEGKENIEKYLASGQAAIFFSAHMANWELAPKTAAISGTPLALVYRPSNNPLVEKLVKDVRACYQSEAIAKGMSGARDIMKCLKNGQPVGMLLDQKMNDGIAVPFFGRDAMTAPAVATLARKFKCPVIPAQIIRLEGVRFKVIVHPPLYANDSGDASKDTYDFMCQINRTMEGWIRQHPEQWFWVHNRWPKS